MSTHEKALIADEPLTEQLEATGERVFLWNNTDLLQGENSSEMTILAELPTDWKEFQNYLRQEFNKNSKEKVLIIDAQSINEPRVLDYFLSVIYFGIMLFLHEENGPYIVIITPTNTTSTVPVTRIVGTYSKPN